MTMILVAVDMIEENSGNNIVNLQENYLKV